MLGILFLTDSVCDLEIKQFYPSTCPVAAEWSETVKVWVSLPLSTKLMKGITTHKSAALWIIITSLYEGNSYKKKPTLPRAVFSQEKFSKFRG